MSSRLVVSLALMVVAGCHFDAPSFDGTSFRCEPPDERCPDGFHCVDGTCVRDDEGPDGPPGDGAPGIDSIDAGFNPNPTFGNRSDADFQGTADDTTLFEADPDSMHGADPNVDIDSSPVKVGLTRFDLSGLPDIGTVTSAELEVTIFDPLENGVFEGYIVLETWSEIGATWNQRINPLLWMGAGVTGGSRGTRVAMFAPRTTGTVTVSIPAAVIETWRAAPITNAGLVWISTSTDARGGQFYSSEHPVESERPLLRLTLSP